MTPKLKNWLQFSVYFDRAQKVFEQKSGWKSRELSSTLKKFSHLDRTSKLFFGGLLVGQALRPVKTSSRPRTATPRTTRPRVRSEAPQSHA
ncbi:MAG: hypothetical protein HY537_12445 [Deltaproteobacteria bacterium]|nr:hypothetical protein [Deltaproteobacteria bacterium]